MGSILLPTTTTSGNRIPRFAAPATATARQPLSARSTFGDAVPPALLSERLGGSSENEC